jgi:hypothetical protein
MVAIGLLGDEANRTQLRTVRCDGIPWQRRRSRALVQAKQGYAGGFPFRHSRAGKSVQIGLRIAASKMREPLI